jgi:hypothetical protein
MHEKLDKLADDYRLVRFRFADLLRTSPSFSGDPEKCRDIEKRMMRVEMGLRADARAERTLP